MEIPGSVSIGVQKLERPGDKLEIIPGLGVFRVEIYGFLVGTDGIPHPANSTTTTRRVLIRPALVTEILGSGIS